MIISSAIDFGKSALGIVTGDFDNINQMQTAVKTGGIIDSVSDVLDYTINKVVEKGKINSLDDKSLGCNFKLTNSLILSMEYALLIIAI